jgi:glycosyltransferase involved in cell wall biosynthesis
LASQGLRIKFLIVGPGLSNYHLYLKNKYSQFPSIEFVGYVAGELVPYYVNAADICLAPYKPMLMNFSITLKLLQYLASCKLTFVTRIPDTKKVFSDIVVEYGDVDELVEKIEKVKKDYGQYSDLSEKGRRIAAQFSWSKIAEKYETLLKKLVDNYR